MTTIEITEYTDPTCPFAWSAEPSRRRIEWLYGDGLAITPRMVGLQESAQTMRDAGMTPDRLSAGMAHLADAHHMPMNTGERPRTFGSVPACRALVAVRENAPGHARAMLRALRIEHFAGNLIDEPATLRAAAERAGVDPDELERWMAEPTVEQTLRADMRAARDPSPRALALPGKLASLDGGGHRYTCPSWELAAGDRSLSVPGFQPLAAYEVAIANLAPDLPRRDDPETVAEVLDWAGEPLATAEVAAVCGMKLDAARQALGPVAAEEPVGADGMWQLA